MQSEENSNKIQIENSESNNKTNSEIIKRKNDFPLERENTEKNLFPSENPEKNLKQENNNPKISCQKNCTIKKIIIIISSIILCAVLIVILIYLIKKSDDDKKPKNETKTQEDEEITKEEIKIDKEIEPEEEEEKIAVEEDKIEPEQETTTEKEKPIYEKINLNEINIEEVNSLIGGNAEENYKNIKSSLNKIDEILNNIEKTNSKEIKKINYEPNNLNISSYLNEPTSDPNDHKKAIAKEDIELYNEKIKELSEKSNEYSQNISESIKNIMEPVNNLKNELEKIKENFEDTMKVFSLPLILEQKGLIDTSDLNLRRLDLSETMEDYKNKVAQFNDLYNDFLSYITETINSINQVVNDVPNFAYELNDFIVEEISNFTNLVEHIDESNLHNNLISIKNSFKDLKNTLNEKISKLNESISNHKNSYEKMKNDLLNFQNNFDELAENITELSNIIINETSKTNDIEIENKKYSKIIIDTIINSLSEPYEKIIKFEVMNIIFELVTETGQKTSLDLLFIMDLTGSMGPYLNETKENLMYIINEIIYQSPGISINLGFIGYRDVGEVYHAFDFTQNYTDIQNEISELEASGGKDLPEDVAWAFESALEMNWTSNAKFIVFIADAPGHGNKYTKNYDTKYPEGIPGRKDIEELVKEMSDEYISMLCLRISEETDKMFEIFKNVYEKNTRNIFNIVDIEGYSFADEIVNSCNDIYYNQRNIEI